MNLLAAIPARLCGYKKSLLLQSLYRQIFWLNEKRFRLTFLEYDKNTKQSLPDLKSKTEKDIVYFQSFFSPKTQTIKD